MALVNKKIIRFVTHNYNCACAVSHKWAGQDMAVTGVLASFSSRARGIKFYDVSTIRIHVGNGVGFHLEPFEPLWSWLYSYLTVLLTNSQDPWSFRTWSSWLLGSASEVWSAGDWVSNLYTCSCNDVGVICCSTYTCTCSGLTSLPYFQLRTSGCMATKCVTWVSWWRGHTIVYRRCKKLLVDWTIS